MTSIPTPRHGTGNREHRAVVLWVDGVARYVCCRESWFRVATPAEATVAGAR